MAGPKGLLALIAGPKAKDSSGSAPPLREPGESSSSPLHEKAEALKSMWGNMKAGDFDAAAMDFHDAYMACQKAENEEDDEGDDGYSGEPGDEPDDEEI